MNAKRVLGVALLIGGVVAYSFGMYIKDQVEEGEGKISSAQEKVDKGNQLFSMNPVAKEIGGHITDGAQRKIDAGKEQVALYSKLAAWFQIGGVAIAVLGAAVIYINRKSGKR